MELAEQQLLALLTHPAIAHVYDAGDLQAVNIQMSASDADSGVTAYRYGIGTQSALRDVVEWTPVTGSNASARNGVIANNWFDLSLTRADKRVYCSEDVANPASTSRDPVVSPVNLKVPTLGDRMKEANPASRNVAVSAKDRAVVMMGGHTLDAGYWWKGNAFVTFAGRQLSPAVIAQNSATAALREWTRVTPPIGPISPAQNMPAMADAPVVSASCDASWCGSPKKPTPAASAPPSRVASRKPASPTPPPSPPTPRSPTCSSRPSSCATPRRSCARAGRVRAPRSRRGCCT